MNARTTALSALIAMRRQNAWADGALKEYTARARLDRRDAALCARLLYGVVQNRMLLDLNLCFSIFKDFLLPAPFFRGLRPFLRSKRALRLEV